MDSDLQTLEDSFCETIDVNVTMEIAQSMLDRYQPLVEELKKSYPTMKDLGMYTILCVCVCECVLVCVCVLDIKENTCGTHCTVHCILSFTTCVLTLPQDSSI